MGQACCKNGIEIKAKFATPDRTPARTSKVSKLNFRVLGVKQGGIE